MPKSEYLSGRHKSPAPRHPPATSTASNTSSQEPALWGRGRTPTPTTPGPKEKGQRAHSACPKDGLLGEGDCPHHDTPHGGTRRPPPPLDALLPPNSVQGQLARVCAAGSMMRPNNAHPLHPRTEGSRPLAADPNDWPLGVGECPNPDTPDRGTRCSPLPGRPLATPKARNGSSQEHALCGG